MADYRFLDEWHLQADIDRVYDLLARPVEYPSWWGQMFLAAEGDGGEAASGKRTTVRAHGFLPYRLRFTMTCVEADRPTRIHSTLEGDFEGTGTWMFEEEGEGTHAVLDWRPSVRKPVVRELRCCARSSAPTTRGRCAAASRARAASSQRTVNRVRAARPCRDS
jgi:uncharacterized protein YndB with AHSA1/START domain